MAAKQAKTSWEGVLLAAKEAGAKYPELVAAQWALESERGKSPSGENNYFGLKGPGAESPTTEYINGAPVAVQAEFLDFSGLEECVDYLVSRWYKDWKGHKGVNRAASREAAAKDLVKQGYATDPAYAEKLIKLMADKPSTPAAKPVEKSAQKPTLFKVEALQNTWLKKLPEQASALSERQKLAVHRQKTYGVVGVTEIPRDAHIKVELAAEAGTWFIYAPHWAFDQKSGEAITAKVDWEDFNCLVTPHLTVGEILQWDRRRIPPVNSSVRPRLLATAAEFQRLRDAWGRPLGVTSFYRPEPINQQVGGVPGSQHVSGKAMDIYPTTASIESFYHWIRVRWRGGLGDGRHRGFIHLDTEGGGFVPGGGATPRRSWTY